MTRGKGDKKSVCYGTFEDILIVEYLLRTRGAIRDESLIFEALKLLRNVPWTFEAIFRSNEILIKRQVTKIL